MSKKDPEGKYYYLAQKAILNLALKGVIICICSKNNERIFLFTKKKKDFLIKNKHIVLKINWIDKHKNIHDVTSYKFEPRQFCIFDDGEFEINLVKKYCKNVISFKVPKNIKKYPLVINKIKIFLTAKRTEEDKKISYYRKLKREKLKKTLIQQTTISKN